MDSCKSTQQYAPHLLLCLFAEFWNEEDEFRWIQFRELPIRLPILSDPQYESCHIRPLDWCNNIEGTYDNISCWICENPIVCSPFYSCKLCSIGFHKECIEPISKHPYHPKHSLRVVQRIHGFYSRKTWLCCLNYSFRQYVCSICDSTICDDCATKPPLLVIDNPKRHQHRLFYFPRKASSICDVCTSSNHRSLMYSCLQCDFLTHKDCVLDMPSIISISRHKHRLSFNILLTPEKWFCGVCRRKIDTNYGRYTCVKGCSFGVHSRCATRKDVWDGKELEGKPEDAFEDIKSFDEVSDGIIQHFSHQNHHMRLDDETNREFDENKRCQACTLPICDDIIYNCMQCDFILHQDCAYLPRKRHHLTHPHPLSLQVDHQGDSFKCIACNRYGNGFAYVCSKRDCDSKAFTTELNCVYKLDVCCASIVVPLDHPCHPHPLFLTFKPLSLEVCSICQRLRGHRLNCEECGFILCFRYATFPNKFRYKHDEHFLTFFS